MPASRLNPRRSKRIATRWTGLPFQMPREATIIPAPSRPPGYDGSEATHEDKSFPYPVPTAAPGAPTVFTGTAGNGQVLLQWQGVPLATAGYNLRRGAASGGPYTILTNGLSGASYVDSGLVNGTTMPLAMPYNTHCNQSRRGAPCLPR